MTMVSCTGEARRWYAVHARTNHERLITRQLQLREIEVFYPSYVSQRQWKNRSRPKLEMPLLPGYVFVRIAEGERLRVIEVSGVVGIVGNGRMMLPICAEEIEQMRAGCREGKLLPHPVVRVGDRARIVRGPLAGFSGIVVQQRGALRIVLNVECASKAVAVEVTPDEIEADQQMRALCA